ncbi:hypothetical protein BFS06_13970 [Clostridium perfringens]|nr:hypothetical protein BFS06_13970 [Clostridium perfringens]
MKPLICLLILFSLYLIIKFVYVYNLIYHKYKTIRFSDVLNYDVMSEMKFKCMKLYKKTTLIDVILYYSVGQIKEELLKLSIKKLINYIKTLDIDIDENSISKLNILLKRKNTKLLSSYYELLSLTDTLSKLNNKDIYIKSYYKSVMAYIELLEKYNRAFDNCIDNANKFNNKIIELEKHISLLREEL